MTAQSYYLANRDKLLARQKEYYANHRDSRVAYQRQYYKLHYVPRLRVPKPKDPNYRIKHIVGVRSWQKKNKDRVREIKLRYLQKHREAYLDYHRNYYQKNKDKLLKYQRNYRAIKKAGGL
jgi:hypothetical protein